MTARSDFGLGWHFGEGEDATKVVADGVQRSAVNI
jgi:hypothetical protein